MSAFNAMLKDALGEIESMSADEMERRLVAAGYRPKRKDPEDKEKDLDDEA